MEDLAARLALACNILGHEGQSDMILGHLSARPPGGDRVLMKPAGLGLEEVTAGDMIVIDLDGKKLDGERKRHSEYPIHTEIYRKRPDVACVVHTHPPFATALGATGATIRPVSHEGVLFAGCPVFTETTLLIREPGQGRALARCLGEHKAVLMQNHGVVVVGASIEEATVNAILLEKAARIQLLAAGSGNMVWTADEELAIKAEQIFRADNMLGFFAYYERRLGRTRGPATDPL